jgi:hypothetical protein
MSYKDVYVIEATEEQQEIESLSKQLCRLHCSIKEMEKLYKQISSYLKLFFKEHELIYDSQGIELFSYREFEKKVFLQTEFRENYPQLYNDFCEMRVERHFKCKQ